jgi:N-acetylglucosaminyl-diphospho-decaprenol L-rhamnosyltransferase
VESAATHGVIAVVINYNTAPLTRLCTRSLLDAAIPRVFVLDNASAPDDYARLCSDHAGDEGMVRIMRSGENLGFAAGSNRLIHEALGDSRCARVLLLNSDAVVDARGLDAALRAMHSEGHDLMGGRMMKPPVAGEEPEVDSLGMTLYKSLLASNRKSTGDTYLGPTGGLAVYSRRFLEEIERVHGEIFDASYFCYAEDTDLCVRARLLGYSAGYVDQAVAWHEGQASIGGASSEFVLYHGIRNSIWMAAKSIPLRVIVPRLPWFIALHFGIVLRHVMRGEARTVWRLYRDALRGLPKVLAKRRLVQSTRRIEPAAFASCIDRHFYETRFLDGAIRDLFRRPRGHENAGAP